MPTITPIMEGVLGRLKWTANPFEPSASGAPIFGDIVLSDSLRARATTVLETHATGTGPKVVVVVGEYGIGKSCLLHWLYRRWFPDQQLRSFYFDNPEVQFYDLANRLLRHIGRKNFAKFIWELAGSYVPGTLQRDLFRAGFEEYLVSTVRRRHNTDITQPLQQAILTANITTDEQIANCLARIVTGIAQKPYFSYQDFVPRSARSLVAAKEEPKYFAAILNTITRGTGANGVAFLIDEFEEIGLQKRLTRRAAHDYLATLKRLVNLAQSTAVEFWVVLSMTPDAYATTKSLEPALLERVTGGKLEIPALTANDGLRLVKTRIDAVRSPAVAQDSTNPYFPFPDTMSLRPATYSNPRRLVKVCFRAIAHATPDQEVPFTLDYLRRTEEDLYGSESNNDH